MIPIAFTFVITALWLILSPWSLSATLTLNGIILVISAVIALYSALKSQFWRLAHSLSIITGILVSTLLYLPALKDYQTISHNLPQTVSALFQIERNQYPTSTTIQIISAQEISTTTHESSDSPHLEKPPTITENHEVPANFYKALQGSTLRVYNVHPDIKASLQEGERYQGTISLRPRYFRNIPGDNQRIYQALARKEIGYGRFESPLQKVAPQSFIEHFRQQTASYFVQQFQHSSYLSALSVGITHYLSEKDWEYLRQTGTIHLVSISGLHLSLTAFYAFIIFRMIAGLLAIRCISPYKIAAFLSVIIAWNYAFIAGLSLPTVRAAIMFSIAMLALLINRPIFSLQGVSIALLAILIHQPLSLLLPGFWLSFVAVIILILASKIFSTPLKALLLTQLIISLILIPLTASFFGEISLISPLINLFAIPWTSLMIMPPLLLGTLLLMIHTPTAKVFIAIADHSIDLLTQVIHLGAQIPYASVKTTQLPLLISLIITTYVLWILYLIPRFPLFMSDYPDLASRCIAFYQRLYYPIKRLKMITITTTMTVMMRIVLSIFVLLTIFFYLKPFLSPKKSPENHESLTDMKIENPNNSDSDSDIINLYLLPAGEGLSFLFHSKALTFLFDTGNRFRNFDAGRQVVLPTLQSLNIKNLDQLFLSLQNQQHIGGTRSIRNKFPQTQITAHPKLLWLIHDAQNCQQYHYQSSTINIQPIKEIHSSCAFHITLFKTISLYLFSDITELEWQHFLQKNDLSQQKAFTHQILLFPHQGRRNYQTNLLFNSENQVSNTTFNTILFSTKTPALHLQQTLQDHPFTETYNAYYGTIHLSIFHKNAKSFSKLRIQNYADHARYWWLKP